MTAFSHTDNTTEELKHEMFSDDCKCSAVCLAGACQCQDGHDPGQQCSHSSRQTSAHHRRAFEVPGEFCDHSLLRFYMQGATFGGGGGETK